MTPTRAAELARSATGWAAIVTAALFAYAGARIAMDIRGTRPPVEARIVEEEAVMEMVAPADELDAGPLTVIEEDLAATDAGVGEGGPLAGDESPVRVRVTVRGPGVPDARVTIDGIEAGGVPFETAVECYRGATLVVQVSAPGHRSAVSRTRCRDGARFEVSANLPPWR